MTRGKNADSDIPRNHRRASMPLKFFTVATSNVKHPKLNIMHGRTLLGPYFFPRMARNGAVKTYSRMSGCSNAKDENTDIWHKKDREDDIVPVVSKIQILLEPSCFGVPQITLIQTVVSISRSSRIVR